MCTFLLSLCSATGAWAEKPQPAKKDTPAASEKKQAKKEPKNKGKKDSTAKSSRTESSRPTTGRPGEIASMMLFFDGSLRYDSGRYTDFQAVGRMEPTDDDTDDIKGFGPLLRLGFIKKLSKHIGLGAAFGYGFQYKFSQRLTKEERDNDREPERWDMGQLLILDTRLEWSQHVSDPLALVVTPIVGISTILPSDALKSETREAKGDHALGPRLGVLFGGEMGVRYFLNDWFSLRGVGGYSYHWQSMLHGKRRGEAADSKRVIRTTTSRLSATIAVEASF